MFKNDVKNIFPLLIELYDLDGLILVGSDVVLWKELVEQSNIQDVHYINVFEHKLNVFSETWYVHDQLLAKEDGNVSYYKMSNPLLNGTVPSEVFATLWKNLQTLEEIQKKSLSLSSFMQEVKTQKNALIVNSFEIIDLLHQKVEVDVVIARTIESDEEGLTHYSKKALDEQMIKLGYKLIASIEDNHPQVFTVVYVFDTEKQKEQLTQQVQAKTKELETEKTNSAEKQKQLEELTDAKSTLSEQLKQEQEQKTQLETEIKTSQEKEKVLQKELESLKEMNEKHKNWAYGLKAQVETLEQEKQNLEKEKETLASQITQKESEKQKLQQELEEKTKLNAVNQEKLKKQLEEQKTSLVTEMKAFQEKEKTLQHELEALKAQNKQKEQLNQNLSTEKETLTSQITQKESEKQKLQQELEETKTYFENRKKQVLELEKLTEEQKKKIDELSKKKNFSSDAKIDSFINDIEPFFYNKAITYVDIGAFEGEILIKIEDSRKIKIREAHLFEPNPQSYEKLITNIKNIPISSLHTYNYAIGNERKTATFSSAKSMTKQITSDVDVDKSSNLFETEVVPLDDMTSSITEKHVHLLKIDVEGNELSVLEGAEELLSSQNIDMIYMEVGFNMHGLQQTYFCKLDKYLQERGYRVFKFYEQTREWIEDLAFLRRSNVLYISEKFAKNNPHNLMIENKTLKEQIATLKKEVDTK